MHLIIFKYEYDEVVDNLARSLSHVRMLKNVGADTPPNSVTEMTELLKFLLSFKLLQNRRKD